MASGRYNRLKYNLMKKLVDLAGDTIKAILLNSSHSFNAADNVYSDISANELATSGGYTTGGQTMSGKTVTQDDVNDCATFDADDVSWTGATFTTRHIALVDTTASDSLILSIDFGADQTVSSGTFTVQWHTNGILRLS